MGSPGANRIDWIASGPISRNWRPCQTTRWSFLGKEQTIRDKYNQGYSMIFSTATAKVFWIKPCYHQRSHCHGADIAGLPCFVHLARRLGSVFWTTRGHSVDLSWHGLRNFEHGFTVLHSWSWRSCFHDICLNWYTSILRCRKDLTHSWLGDRPNLYNLYF